MVHELPADDHAVVMMTVPASIEDCFNVAVDVESYPEWLKGIDAVEVQKTDDVGRALRARFVAGGLGRSTEYVLAYDLDEAPNRFGWTMVEGDLTSRLEGAYRFEGNPEGGTDVTYELIVEMSVPLPGFVKRRAEDKILEAAMRGLADRILAGTGNELIQAPKLHRG